MKTPLTTVALLTVLALIACAGTSGAASKPLSRAAYSSELQLAGRSLTTALNALGEKPSDFTRIETHVPQSRAVLEQTAARLAANTPPVDARSDNAKLVHGLRYYAAQLPKLKSAAAHHDAKAVTSFDGALDRAPAMQAMMAAVSDLQREGYKVGELAPSGKP